MTLQVPSGSNNKRTEPPTNTPVQRKGEEIQLKDALLKLLEEEAIYAYNFEGKIYCVGDKQGFLDANIKYALRNSDLK